MSGQPVLFGGTDHFLSNFWPAPLKIDGRAYATVEHYYQAQKFVHDPKIYDGIAGAAGPAEAKRISREHIAEARPDWESVKDGVMQRACRAKFEQHEDLRRMLMETGNRQLIENSPTDNYWGMVNGEGQNRLGEILMRLRREFA